VDIWGGISRGTGDCSAACSGCVERSGGLEDANLPLSAPTGVQLALTPPKLVEGRSANFALKRSEKGLLGGNSCQDRRRRSLTDAVEQVRTTQSKQLLEVNNYIKRCSFEGRCGSVVSTLKQDSPPLPSAASLSNPTTPQSRQSACRLRGAKRPRD
jgi:hypothetical protein